MYKVYSPVPQKFEFVDFTRPAGTAGNDRAAIRFPKFTQQNSPVSCENPHVLAFTRKTVWTEIFQEKVPKDNITEKAIPRIGESN